MLEQLLNCFIYLHVILGLCRWIVHTMMQKSFAKYCPKYILDNNKTLFKSGTAAECSVHGCVQTLR